MKTYHSYEPILSPGKKLTGEKTDRYTGTVLTITIMRLRVIADIINIKMNENLAKIGFYCVRISVIVIHSAYFGAQKA